MRALVAEMLQAVSPSGPTPPFDVDSPTYVAIRFTQFAVVTLLIGLVAFRVAVWPRYLNRREHTDERTSDLAILSGPWLRRGLIMLTVIQVARLAAQHRVYFEDGAWSMATMQPLLWQSGWGLAWLIAAGTILTAFVALRRLASARRAGWWILAGALVVLTWTMAMSGHPAVAPSPRLAMALDALHVIGAGGWVGSLSVMMFLAVPAVLRSSEPDPHQRVARLVAAFSPTALVFAALLGATGALAGWRNVGSWSALVQSDYGRMLLVKLVLVGVIAGIGAINWRRVLPRLGQPSATRTLRRSAVLELTAAVVVLAVTALLVATAMPEPVS